MAKELNKRVIDTIYKYLPEDKNIISFLMDLLNLGRESAYRRVRSDIPFTFSEISRISLALGFSIDEVVEKKDDRIFFDLQSPKDASPSESFYNMILQHHDLIMRLYNAENTEILISQNHLSSVLSIYYDHLFKFMYYKWCHQINKVPLNFYLADTVVPEEIVSIYKKIRYYGPRINNNTYIIDKNIYLNTVKEIQYFYQRKLISDEELNHLKKDLLAHIETLETYIRDGVNKEGYTFNYYLSLFEIESNVSYLEYDGKTESHLWLYATNPIIIKSPEVCAIHKAWLESLIKYSIQIAKSNELMQAEYFNQQYEYINNIDKIMY